MWKNSRSLFWLIIFATAISVLFTSYLTLIKKDFDIVEIEEESYPNDDEVSNDEIPTLDLEIDSNVINNEQTTEF